MSDQTTKTSRGFWARVFAVLGVLSSCIAIFAFFSGFETFLDIFGGRPKSEAPQIVSSSDPTQQPTSTASPEPSLYGGTTLTPMPVGAPDTVPFESPAVEIKLYSATDQAAPYGGAIIQLMGAGQPIQGQEIQIQPAVKTIAGDWTSAPLPLPSVYLDYSPYNIVHKTDVNGVIGLNGLPPGDHILFNYSPDSGSDNLRGPWGIPGADREVIPFPVLAGRVTKVVISLAQLDVGVLRPDGRAAQEAMVLVYCQGMDISGSPMAIPGDIREGCRENGIFYRTGSTGLATLYLAPGLYFIMVEDYDSGDGKYVYDIRLSPGQHREVTVTQKP